MGSRSVNIQAGCLPAVCSAHRPFHKHNNHQFSPIPASRDCKWFPRVGCLVSSLLTAACSCCQSYENDNRKVCREGLSPAVQGGSISPCGWSKKQTALNQGKKRGGRGQEQLEVTWGFYQAGAGITRGQAFCGLEHHGHLTQMGAPSRAALLGPTLPAALGQGPNSCYGRARWKVCGFPSCLCPEGFLHPGKQLLFQWDNCFFKEVGKCLESSGWAGGDASILHP